VCADAAVLLLRCPFRAFSEIFSRRKKKEKRVTEWNVGALALSLAAFSSFRVSS
jgi:hypothetical protein